MTTQGRTERALLHYHQQPVSFLASTWHQLECRFVGVGALWIWGPLARKNSEEIVTQYVVRPLSTLRVSDSIVEEHRS